MRYNVRRNIRIDENSLLVIEEAAKKHKVGISVLVRLAIHRLIKDLVDEDGYLRDYKEEIENEVSVQEMESVKAKALKRPCRTCVWIQRYNASKRKYEKRDDRTMGLLFN
jgi:hypothetical protein